MGASDMSEIMILVVLLRGIKKNELQLSNQTAERNGPIEIIWDWRNHFHMYTKKTMA